MLELKEGMLLYHGSYTEVSKIDLSKCIAGKDFGKGFYTTSSLLPKMEDLQPYLQDIWNRKWLTNNGYYHQELEKALCDYLCIDYISILTKFCITVSRLGKAVIL